MKIRFSLTRDAITRKDIDKTLDWWGYLLAPKEEKLILPSKPPIIRKIFVTIMILMGIPIVMMFGLVVLESLEMKLPEGILDFALKMLVLSMSLLFIFIILENLYFPTKERSFEEWKKMKKRKR